MPLCRSCSLPDRLETWNPGDLPSALTIESVRVPHASIPRNPLIAEPLFLTRYIEKAGSGTLDMIARCRAASLPEPELDLRSGQIVLTLWRDWPTDAALAAMGLDERQKQALTFLKLTGRITNTDYQNLVGGSRRTALRELEGLVHHGVLALRGKGRGAHYVLVKKRAGNTPNAPIGATAHLKPSNSLGTGCGGSWSSQL
jgi:ATP-dependent DNA helicase RecG